MTSLYVPKKYFIDVSFHGPKEWRIPEASRASSWGFLMRLSWGGVTWVFSFLASSKRY